MRAILTVKQKTFLTSHYIRVILEGAALETFAAARVGDNNKIIVPQQGVPLMLPDDPRSLTQEQAQRPIIRTYTMRNLDLEKGEMTIDFVAHGEEGPASRWALYAQKGDELLVMMKEKTKPLFIPSDRYILVGDHTALPVISVLLEILPKSAQATAIIEVYGKEDILDLTKPEGMDIQWQFNKTPGQGSALAEALKNIVIEKDQTPFIFAAAEYTIVDAIQQHIRTAYTLERKQWHAYSYWKHGLAEDASATKRRAQTK